MNSTSSCTDLTGNYSNYSEPEESGYRHQLTSLLNLKHTTASTIQIQVLEKSINLTSNNNKLGQFNLVSDNSYCENGEWVLELAKIQNTGGAIGKEWDKFYFSVTSQGLVVKKEHGVFGALFFIPIAGTETTWLLFKET